MKSTSRFWDVPTAFLLVVVLQICAMRLAITGWTSYLYFTQTIALFGSLLGLALGISRFQSRGAFWLAVAYGLAIVPLHLIRAVELNVSLLEKFSILGNRLLISLAQFIMRKPVDDALFFVALVAIAYFAIAVAAGYWLTRHGNFLVGVILAGMAILIIHGYDSFLASRLWVAAAFAFTALLLMGRVHFVRERERWTDQRVFVSPDSGQDINRQIMVLAAVAILITWTIPLSVTEWQSAAASWNRLMRPILDRFSNAVTSLESPYGTRESSDFYGEQLSLGRVAAQGNTPVIQIKVDGTNDKEPPRYYWRGRVYDQYLNGKWTNSSTSASDFDPSKDHLTISDESKRLEESFTITMKLKEQSLLYMPAEPFWVNRKGSVEFAPVPAPGQDVTAWTADPPLSANSKYQVRALIANPSIAELREAGTDYPDWVNNRYLQIPPEIEPQIKSLAEAVTINQQTPYDKAIAVTQYLRSELQYSTALTELPKNRDPLLWVLFDYKKGFCMYYASAEVLMLRSVGVPARLAVGFAEGKYDNAQQTYTVLRSDSHAWPEVYFPQIGWVEFEPTTNQAPLTRPLGEQANAAEPPGTPNSGLAGNDALHGPNKDEEAVTPTPVPRQANYRIFLNILYGTLVTGLLVAGIFFVQRYSLVERLPVYLESRYVKNGNQPPRWLLRWARWAKLTPIEKSFEAVNLSLRLMGHPPAMYLTPAERAQKLRALLPKASEFIDILAEEHQTSLFTPRTGDTIRARRAGIKVILEAGRARLMKENEYL